MNEKEQEGIVIAYLALEREVRWEIRLVDATPARECGSLKGVTPAEVFEYPGETTTEAARTTVAR